MVDPDVLLPMLKQTGYLPTQKVMMNGTYFKSLNESIPYFSQLTSMPTLGHIRPNIPEYPQIADQIGCIGASILRSEGTQRCFEQSSQGHS